MLKTLLENKFGFWNGWMSKYCDLIGSRMCSPLDGIGEYHHYLPKSIFGKNDLLVKLTTKEHLQAHYYLYMAYKEFPDRNPQHFRKVCFSLSSFRQSNVHRTKRLADMSADEVSEYITLCAHCREANRNAMLLYNPFKGKHHTQEVKNFLSALNTGRNVSETRKSEMRAYHRMYQPFKGIITLYHKVSGKTWRTYAPFAAECVHPEFPWAIGQKFIENTEIYWHPNYLKLKESLRKRESLTGKPHSVEWTNKINKNPEKIRKTALAHTGMKRSAETKAKISAAKAKQNLDRGGAINKGMKLFYNPNNVKERIQCNVEVCPVGWVSGNPLRKHINAETGEVKKFLIGLAPEGWVIKCS